jgi:polyvinyl alcohol dehydrogenase (cytochrome)
VTTGNNYSVPQSALDCVGSATSDTARLACLAPSDYFDSIVALDVQTGAIRWATHALPYDTWNGNCFVIPGVTPAGPCPDPAGPDYDFGQGPALFSARVHGKNLDLVGAGQKSGMYWALDRDTGQVVWFTQGYGSAVGAVTVANGVAYACSFAGTRVAMDASTGQVLWHDPPTGEFCAAGAAVSRGVVYWGNGYGQILFQPMDNGTLTAYGLR